MNATLPPSGPGDPIDEPPDDETFAGELVLGVLDGADLRRARQRALADGSFARLVSAWEQRLSPWLERVAPEAVDPTLWPRLRRRLGWEEERPPARGWQSVVFWRTATVAVAVAAVVGWFLRTPAPPVAPPVASIVSVPPAETAAVTRAVTTLARTDGRPGWLASVDRGRGTVLMVPVPAPADPGDASRNSGSSHPAARHVRSASSRSIDRTPSPCRRTCATPWPRDRRSPSPSSHRAARRPECRPAW